MTALTVSIATAADMTIKGPEYWVFADKRIESVDIIDESGYIKSTESVTETGAIWFESPVEESGEVYVKVSQDGDWFDGVLTSVTPETLVTLHTNY